MFITNGEKAASYITVARTGDGTGPKEITDFIDEKDIEGFTIGKKEKKMGLRGSQTVEINFNQCAIPQENLLEKEGEGYKIAMANLNVGRIGIAAQALGIAEAALEASIDYAKEREQFGKPIAHQQGISFKIGRAHV